LKDRFGLLERSVIEIVIRYEIQEAGKIQGILDEHAGVPHMGETPYTHIRG
jgi:hypothetical protein